MLRQRSYRSSSHLFGDSDNPIHNYGSEEVTFRLGSRDYSWVFLLANAKRSLLGADFLRTCNILVDLREQRLSVPIALHVPRPYTDEVEHFMPTTGPPNHARARRLVPDKLAVVKAEFEAMGSKGIIRRSNKQP